MKRLAPAALALALLALAAGCSKDGPSDETVLTVNGEARVARAGGDDDVVTDETTVQPGDEIRAVRGSFVLERPDGTTIEGRARDGRDPTRLRVDTIPDLLDGEMLVISERPVETTAAGTSFRLAPGGGEGAARLSRSLAVASTSYSGTVSVDSAGQQRTVPRLRTMEVSALGRPPAAARPLVYDETDPWDQRFLGSAMELGRRLEAMARAYTGSLGPDEGTTPGFYRLVLPDLVAVAEFGADLLQVPRPPGETLVGAAIAVLGERGTFRERWQSIFSFRDEGAAWGLVALDQGVGGDPLVGTVEQALNATTFEFTAPPVPPPAPGPTTTDPGATAPPTTGAPGDTPTTSPPPATAVPPPPTSAVAPILPPGDTEILPDTGVPLIDQLIDPIEDLLGLLGG